MHLNPQHPNILHDMQAAASGRYSFNGRIGIDRYGNPCTIWDNKRHLIPRKDYPYASERQVKRQQNKFEVLFNRALGQIEAETQG